MARKLTGQGQGGKTLNDRKLAADVRGLSLRLIKKYLESDKPEDLEYQKQLLLRLSTTVLPRLTEVSGADGQPLRISFDDSFSHDPTPETEGNSV